MSYDWNAIHAAVDLINAANPDVDAGTLEPEEIREWAETLYAPGTFCDVATRISSAAYREWKLHNTSAARRAYNRAIETELAHESWAELYAIPHLDPATHRTVWTQLL